MSWSQIGRLLRTVFLLRVPLIILFILAGLGPFALVPGEKMLGNLFDLRVAHLDPSHPPAVHVSWTSWYLFIVSFTAFTLAWTAVAVINLVLHYGRDRFDDPELELDQKRPQATFLFGLLSALMLVSCAIDVTPLDPLLRYGMALLGFVCSMALVVLAKIIQLAFTDPQTTPHPPPYLVFPVYTVASFEQFFDSIYCWHPHGLRNLKSDLNGVSQWFLEIFRGAGQGYLVDCAAPRGKLTLRSGHVFAIASSLTAFALYLAIGFSKEKINANPTIVPALAFFLLFLVVTCWFLGALTFFFDRYRVPLLACVAILSITTTYAPESDHYYRIKTKKPPPLLFSPSALVAAHHKAGHKRLIFVATAGGGIQAAAWTARVLRGLEEACDHPLPPAAQCNFRDSIVLISAVSGGSLGAMAYVRSFVPPSTGISSATAVTNAETSAIDEVAWGWTVPDLFRTITPWFHRQAVDRGWALEQKWSAIHQLRNPKTNEDTYLSDWAPSSKNLWPALLLNATVIESGRPIVFSDTDFPPNQPKDDRGLINFYDLYPLLNRNYDIRVNTAARLSSSFPYVAPAARSNITNPPVPDFHIVDGGYYDNFGVVTLLGWLQNALDDSTDPARQSEVKQALADVLVFEIRPYATSVGQEHGSRHGWGFQLNAPIDAILKVRDFGQGAHDDTELALFSQAYGPAQSNSGNSHGINVWRADFEYPSTFEKGSGCLEAPLSWKLSIDQLNCIDKGWQQFKNDDKGKAAINCVLHFLNEKEILTRAQPNFCRPRDPNE